MSTLIGSAIQNAKSSFTPRGAAWALWAGILVIIGLAALINYLIHGHDAYGTTRQVPWGILISTYVFFVVSSTGLCLVSSLGHVFGFKQFEVIGKRAIVMAIATILAGFAVIATEIGYPFRMLIYNFVSPNFTAAIWWMGTLYGLYLLFIMIEFGFMMKINHKYAGYAGLAAFIAGIAAHSNLGAVFGLLDARSWWSGPYLPIYFILSAAATGCAIVLLMFAVRYAREAMPDDVRGTMLAISKLFCFLLGILIFFGIWKMISSLYAGTPGKYEGMMALISGPLWISYWGFEVFLGLLLPFVLILATKGKNLGVAVFAAASSLIGIFFMRYNLVVAGQLKPMRYDPEVVGASGLVSYAPSITEIGIVLGGIGLCLLMYIAANMIFNLDADEHH